MEPWTLVAVTSQAGCYDLLVQCEASGLNKWLSEQFAWSQVDTPLAEFSPTHLHDSSRRALDNSLVELDIWLSSFLIIS